ncbi:MAG: hypothetical protein JWO57_2940 [Pseudonocardiales bacterium]|nr:hypothetical protein [Pseudonocardiales bacterium]
MPSSQTETPEFQPDHQPVDATIQRIDQHMAVLDSMRERPLPEHADVYQRLHVELQDALAEIDGN